MAEWTRARTANATILQDALTPFAGRDGIIRLGGPLGQDASWPEGSVHAFYKYYVYVRPENLASGWSRDQIVTEIGKRGIPCFQEIGRAACRERVCQYV